LATLQGLENLTMIGGDFIIYTNPALNGLTEMNNLTSIGRDLKILWNTALTSLSSMQNIKSIGRDLWIGWNYSLTSLSGLDSIAAGSIDNLTIEYNFALSVCEVQSVCDYLAAPNGTVIIQNNAPGCNSPAEVQAACAVGMDEAMAGSGFSIYPNPFTTHTTIEFHLPKTSLVSIQIFNAMGVRVAELHRGPLPAGQQQFTWHTGNLPKGLYFCRVQVGMEAASREIMRL